MADISFKTKKKTRATIKFTLDDHLYSFKPPKVARAILPAIMGDITEAKASMQWLYEGLTKADQKILNDRLMDEDDDFDVEDIGPIIEKLIETAGANPTS